MTFLRDTLAVARYELAEAARTRLLQVVIGAYLLGVGFADWILVRILREMEGALAERIGLPRTETPGAMINTLRDNGDLLALLKELAGSEAGARALIDAPILGLWAGGAAMFLLPAVMIAATAGTVAAEIRSRSLRYLLVRTGRLPIAAGKLVGQLAIVALAVGAGVVVSWGMGMVLMVGNPPAELFVELVVRSAYGFLFALPFAGIGIAASMAVPNPNVARIVAGLALVLSPAADWWLEEHAGPDTVGRLADLGTLLLPNHLWTAFWGAQSLEVVGASVHGTLLAVMWFALGFSVFQRRNL